MSSFVDKNKKYSFESLKYLSNNTKLSTKSSENNEKIKKIKPKKININKFLTREKYYEHKRNLNIEKKRFEILLREQDYFKQKLYLTERSIGKNKLNKKNPFSKKELENNSNLDIKRNNTIERTKINNLSELKKNIKNKYKKKKLNINQINKFCNNNQILKEKNNSIKIESQKEDQKKSNDLSQINNKKSNHINKKAKYKHEEIIYGIYKKKELMKFKKKYLENKYSYQFKPMINDNYKYNKISPKYNKIIRNKIIKKNNSNSYNRPNLSNNDNNSNIIKHKKKSNKSENRQHWTSLLRIINKTTNFDENTDIKDKTYYLNVNQNMPWKENTINEVIYKEQLNDILNVFTNYK